MATSDPRQTNPLIGRRVRLVNHFDDLVVIEALRPIGTSFELRVRRVNGQLEETVLSADEFAALVELGERARQVRDRSSGSKLAALRECLNRAQFEGGFEWKRTWDLISTQRLSARTLLKRRMAPSV